MILILRSHVNDPERVPLTCEDRDVGLEHPHHTPLTGHWTRGGVSSLRTGGGGVEHPAGDKVPVTAGLVQWRPVTADSEAQLGLQSTGGCNQQVCSPAASVWNAGSGN